MMGRVLNLYDAWSLSVVCEMWSLWGGVFREEPLKGGACGGLNL